MTPTSLEYCVLRIVPDIERAEFLNTGVIIVCRARRLLDCRLHLDRTRLLALWPSMDTDTIDLIQAHLRTIDQICHGERAGGPMASLDWRERWHWLTSPASTIVQPGPVHTALTENPDQELDRLFERYVTA
jgi:hypothetical protein